MPFIVNGKAVVLDQDDVSTDQIYPGQYLNLTNPSEIAEHTLEGADKTLKGRLKGGSILVVGSNFACGSSREQAVICLKELGVKVVIANSVARIWYRNAINLALPVIICPGFVKEVNEGDELEVDLKEGTIKNITSGVTNNGEPVSDFVLDIFANGGIKPMIRSRSSD